MLHNPNCPVGCITNEEQNVLEQRYADAKSYAERQQLSDIINTLEEVIRGGSYIVIHLSVDALYEWVRNSEHYENIYDLGKTPTETRTKADRCLFGECGRHIRYAALSLNRKGIASYGKCAVSLKELPKMIVLEENSYQFILKNRCVENRDSQGSVILSPPLGCRSGWQHRYKLVIAKLHDKVTLTTGETEFPQLVLNDMNDKKKSDYFEICICGTFTKKEIEFAGIVGDFGDDEEMLTVIEESLEDGQWKGKIQQ